MAQISRLKDPEISNGNTINADDLDDEFDQLVNESNSQDTRLTTIESGTTTFSSVKTFGDGIKTDTILEETTSNGVDVDGVLCKDGYINVHVSAGPTAVQGDVWEVGGALKYHNGTTSATLATSSSFPALYKAGSAVEYVSSTQIRIPAGFRCRDDSDAVDITFSSAATIDISATTSASAVNRLMNGLTESSNTWYYVWAISKASGADPAGLLTTSSSTIATPPTDYSYKRLLMAVKNNSSSNIEPFFVAGWPDRPFVIYNQATQASSGGETQVINGGSSTSYVTVSLSSFLPAISRACTLSIFPSGSFQVNVRQGGISGNGYQFTTPSLGFGYHEISSLTTSSTQEIEYKVASGNITANIVGFYITDSI